MRDKYGNVVVQSASVLVKLTIRSEIIEGKVKRIIAHDDVEKEIAVVCGDCVDTLYFVRSRQVEVIKEPNHEN